MHADRYCGYPPVKSGTWSNPAGLTSGDNIFDIVYDESCDCMYGLVTSGEGGTATFGQHLVKFNLGGSVTETYIVSEVRPPLRHPTTLQ